MSSTAVLTRSFAALLVLLALPIYKVSAENLSPAGFDLGQYHGKVVYLDFWASWCGPCRATFPLMNAMRSEYAADELEIIAVNVDSNHADAQRFLQKFPADFSILYDPEGILAARYNLQGMPSSFLYNRDGELVDTHVGFRKKDAEKIRTAIRELLTTE